MAKRMFAAAMVIALLVPAVPDAPAAARAQMTDNQFLDTLQRACFDFFWQEANPSNGLIKDRSSATSPSSIASIGFGLSAICIGIDHGWITREAGRDRVLTTLRTFWNGPQGTGESSVMGYKGFFYHFLDMNTGHRTWSCELSSIDTGLLLAGIIDAKQYFDAADSLDGVVRALADSIYYRMDWNWFRNGDPSIEMGWVPSTKFGTFGPWIGYNEAMILYILALGSPTYPVPAGVWQTWTSGYSYRIHYGYAFIEFPPLFGHQYSHCWIDFRSINDAVMRPRGFTYFENSRRATLAQRAYCAANPKAWVGYSDTLWGITACDSPPGPLYPYSARGAPPAQNDDGTIAPTAVGGSIAFAPEVCIPTLRSMYDTYRSQIWMKYGFRDAFNLTQNWWGPDVIGIDQGPIIIMIENYRTQRVWNRFMRNPDIQRGLERAGFLPVTAIEPDGTNLPGRFRLEQNYPNPFNGQSHIRYSLGSAGPVRLEVYDLAGRRVAVLVNAEQSAGDYEALFDAGGVASGAYTYRLTTTEGVLSRALVLLK
jgi:hypothetical protein